MSPLREKEPLRASTRHNVLLQKSELRNKENNNHSPKRRSPLRTCITASSAPGSPSSSSSDELLKIQLLNVRPMRLPTTSNSENVSLKSPERLTSPSRSSSSQKNISIFRKSPQRLTKDKRKENYTAPPPPPFELSPILLLPPLDTSKSTHESRPFNLKKRKSSDVSLNAISSQRPVSDSDQSRHRGQDPHRTIASNNQGGLKTAKVSPARSLVLENLKSNMDKIDSKIVDIFKSDEISESRERINKVRLEYSKLKARRASFSDLHVANAGEEGKIEGEDNVLRQLADHGHEIKVLKQKMDKILENQNAIMKRLGI